MSSSGRSHTRFWVEAQVSLAKAAVFLSAAEEDARRGSPATAGVHAYYSLFHLVQAFMWLRPECLPSNLHETLLRARDQGGALPDRQTTHSAVGKFIRSGQLRLPGDDLPRLFEQALRLREFASYGPRVTYDGGRPTVGPCDVRRQHVVAAVGALCPTFIDALAAVAAATELQGAFGRITVEKARVLLSDNQFPFRDWFPDRVVARADAVLMEAESRVSARTQPKRRKRSAR